MMVGEAMVASRKASGVPDAPPQGADVTHRIGVLISGRGSNLQALIDAIAAGRLQAEIAVVISNRADAPGLDRARRAGIETLVRPHKDAPSREAYDQALVADLTARGVGLVVLAGFMRLLTAGFCDAFPNAIINVHPSLLPAFPGVDAQGQALAAGVAVSGATVHFVTPALDAWWSSCASWVIGSAAWAMAQSSAVSGSIAQPYMPKSSSRTPGTASHGFL